MQLSFMRMQMGALQPNIQEICRGTVKGYRFGFLTFKYPNGDGPAQPVNFLQQAFFPEYPNASGATVYIKPGQSWGAYPFAKPLPGLNLTTETGIVNFADGITAGVSEGNFTPILNAESGGLVFATTPMDDGTGSLTATTGGGGNLIGNAVNGTSELIPYSTMVAFASEIAQATVMINSAFDTENFDTFSGYVLNVPASGVPRWFSLNLVEVPTIASNNFGSTGMAMCGHYAWDYGGYCGRLQYINAQQTYSVPEGNNATGMNVWLKPGITANAEMGVNTYQSQSMFNSLGEINLAANILKGLGVP